MTRHIIFYATLLSSAAAIRLGGGAGTAPTQIADSGSTAEQMANLKALLPVAWVHIPKTGTSFVNTLISHPGICPNMPKNTFCGADQHGFWQAHKKAELCPNGFSTSFISPPGHHGIGPYYEQNKGKVIAFFRQPESRLGSAYNYGLHSWPLDRKPKDKREFAEVVKGCATRMLNRDGPRQKGAGPWVCGGKGDGTPGTFRTPVTQAEITTAVARVNEMPFVGLTEQFDFSICLFHTMFGGTCGDHEFVNTRRNHKKKPDFGNFTDDIDGPVYEAATKRFWSLMKQYNVDRASCEKTCQAAEKHKPFSLSPEVSFARVETGESLDYKFDWPGRKSDIIDEVETDQDEDE